MPKDEWLRAKNRDLASGRDWLEERDQEENRLAALDEFISQTEESKIKKNGKLRKCCATPKGRGPHAPGCCNKGRS